MYSILFSIPFSFFFVCIRFSFLMAVTSYIFSFLYSYTSLIFDECDELRVFLSLSIYVLYYLWLWWVCLSFRTLSTRHCLIVCMCPICRRIHFRIKYPILIISNMLLEFRNGFSIQEADLIPSHNNPYKSLKQCSLRWFFEEVFQHFISGAIIHCKGTVV